MRPLRIMLVYLAAIFLGGVILAPLLYHAAQALATTFPSLHGFARIPFHRFVNRALILIAILGLWPFLRANRLFSLQAVGLSRSPRAGSDAGWGLAIGFASLAVAAGMVLLAGMRVWAPAKSGAQLFGQLLSAAGSAVAVSCFEELLFRGAVYGAFRQAISRTGAILVSACIYAIVHFFQKPGEPAVVSLSSSFTTLSLMCSGFFDFAMLWPAFLNLLLAGAILGWTRERTGGLYCSIGLHAGWVFWLKTFAAQTHVVSEARPAIWGSSKLIDGYAATIVLILLLVALPKLLPKNTLNSTPPAN